MAPDPRLVASGSGTSHPPEAMKSSTDPPSTSPLPRKLGIKPGHRVALLGAPDGFETGTLGELPGDVKVVRRTGGKADVIVSFHTERAELERRLPVLRAMMEPAAGLWIAWPKRASKVETDITEDVVREVALPIGLVDNKVCAVDETWSGLRFVYRLRDRPARSSPQNGRARRP